MQASVDSGQNMIEIGQVAQRAIEQTVVNYHAPRMQSYHNSAFDPESWNVTSESHVAKVDAAKRSFYQIFKGPYHLTKADGGTLGSTTKKLPVFAGTGKDQTRVFEPDACQRVLAMFGASFFSRDQRQNCDVVL